MATADQIPEHAAVVSADDVRVGTVDHMDGEFTIKLTKTDSDDGRHHLIPLDWVDHVDEHVHLTKMAEEVGQHWTTA